MSFIRGNHLYKMDHNLIINRYPKTSDKSLKVWNSADAYLLEYLEELEIVEPNIHLYNDRFGYLTCKLNQFSPKTIISFKSQEKAITANLKVNNLSNINIQYHLEDIEQSTDIAIVKVPKSTDLFKLFLFEIYNNLKEDGVVLCGFMTKYFSPQLISIAGGFFESVEQSRAYKKSRLLILKGKKDLEPISLFNNLSYKDKMYKQYLGVFAASNIDYASQFLIEHLQVSDNDKKVLDLASGNGVLACCIRDKNPAAQMHLVDDFYLAVASSKLNLIEGENYFHFNDNLDELENDSFDLVVSNPPFHFDYETNTEISFSLFSQVAKKLKPGGNFQLVANRHLPYKPELEKLFGHVEVVEQNNKFIIYRCEK